MFCHSGGKLLPGLLLEELGRRSAGFGWLGWVRGWGCRGGGLLVLVAGTGSGVVLGTCLVVSKAQALYPLSHYMPQPQMTALFLATAGAWPTSDQN